MPPVLFTSPPGALTQDDGSGGAKSAGITLRLVRPAKTQTAIRDSVLIHVAPIVSTGGRAESRRLPARRAGCMAHVQRAGGRPMTVDSLTKLGSRLRKCLARGSSFPFFDPGDRCGRRCFDLFAWRTSSFPRIIVPVSGVHVGSSSGIVCLTIRTTGLYLLSVKLGLY
jgi:hypothetical protein